MGKYYVRRMHNLVVGPRQRGSRLAVGGENTQHIAYHLSGELCCVIPATRACVCPTDHLTCEHAGIFVQPASILGNFSMGKYLCRHAGEHV